MSYEINSLKLMVNKRHVGYSPLMSMKLFHIWYFVVQCKGMGGTMDLQIEGNKDKNFEHDFSYGKIGLTKYFDMVFGSH